MPVIVLEDGHIRGLISGAVEREHAVAKAVYKVSSGGAVGQFRPADKLTPSRAALKNLEALWQPVLAQVYAMPAAVALKGVLVDPQIGKTRINSAKVQGGIK